MTIIPTPIHFSFTKATLQFFLNHRFRGKEHSGTCAIVFQIIFFDFRVYCRLIGMCENELCAVQQAIKSENELVGTLVLNDVYSFDGVEVFTFISFFWGVGS